MVKTSCFHCRGHWFDSLGTKIPQAAWCSQKLETNKNRGKRCCQAENRNTSKFYKKQTIEHGRIFRPGLAVCFQDQILGSHCPVRQEYIFDKRSSGHCEFFKLKKHKKEGWVYRDICFGIAWRDMKLEAIHQRGSGCSTDEDAILDGGPGCTRKWAQRPVH